MNETSGASWHDDCVIVARQAQAIAGLIMESPSGGTVSIGGAGENVELLTDPVDYPARYVIGGACQSEIIPERYVTLWGSHVWLQVAALLVRASTPYVGWWQSDGHVFVDSLTFSNDLIRAQELATNRGELAIWDSVDGCEIGAVFT